MTTSPLPLDETLRLQLKFGADGLLPAIAQDAVTGDVLMLAYMNAEAFAATVASGRATYWSRSRQALWCKGETSGHVQMVQEIRVDCDQDTVLLKVRQTGAACHTGRPTCFYRAVEREAEGEGNAVGLRPIGPTAP